MKLSEITVEQVAAHAVVSDQDPDYSLIPAYLEAAKQHVLDYTGLTEEKADAKPDLAVAALILTADMLRNKEASTDTAAVNRVLQSFMDLHCVNLL